MRSDSEGWLLKLAYVRKQHETYSDCNYENFSE